MQYLMLTRRLRSLEVDWLSGRVDKWVAQCQGYTRLRSKRLSRGCQTMLDRPLPFWTRSDSELLNDLPLRDRPITSPENEDNDIDISALSLDANSFQRSPLSFYEKEDQYNQDIADYIAYLNKPIINMNDHFIEIHQYHYEPNHLMEIPVRPPTRRKKHKINLKKTEIVENKGISSMTTTPEYSEFLVRRSPDENQNIMVVSERSEEKSTLSKEVDQHRTLKQRSASAGERRVDTVVRVERGQTFTVRSKSPVSNTAEEPHRGFLSFRTTKKNKSGRRKKKVVVGEAGIDGPIWPAVLLTFDRSISPGPPELPDESEV